MRGTSVPSSVKCALPIAVQQCQSASFDITMADVSKQRLRSQQRKCIGDTWFISALDQEASAPRLELATTKAIEECAITLSLWPASTHMINALQDEVFHPSAAVTSSGAP